MAINGASKTLKAFFDCKLKKKFTFANKRFPAAAVVNRTMEI